MAAIKSVKLTRKFGQLTALDNLNLEIPEGEIFGLVGPDGAGKTTTMRLLTGILDPSAGEAWVCDKHTVKESEALKENIAYMSQRFGLYEELSVLENINFYADVYGIGKEKRNETIDRLLSFSGLLPFKERFAGKLSGGMKQKLGLACALIHTPRVLFLDEPTNGVDPVSRRISGTYSMACFAKKSRYSVLPVILMKLNAAGESVFCTRGSYCAASPRRR
jgi:ABC-2 type transport system ATP-binding protein